MMDYSRQREAFEVEKFNMPVHVIGAGATGSWVVLMLAKMGIQNIHVWDFDTVEEHNLPNQAFRALTNWDDDMGYTGTDIGKSKAESIQIIASEATGLNEDNGDFQVTVHNERVDGSQRLSGIVFMLTDTMSSRKEIWEKAIKLKPQVKLLIETRMDLEGGFIYCINPIHTPQIKEYEKTFYTDEQAAVSACGTSQSLVATALHISSVAVWQLINFHNERELPNFISISSRYNNAIANTWG